MKSFTYRLNEKLNTGSNKGKTGGRPAAPQRTAHSSHLMYSWRAADNRGFSLPEIIVAMLLVGIVIVPLLTNFAVSARVNAKSLKTKDVTDYAEQIVETLQSYTPDEVDAQFGGSLDDFDIADISVKTDFGRTNSSFAIGKNDDNSENNTTTTTEKAAQGEPRYYYIRGAKAPSGRTYDVQITYDPRNYATADSADGSVHAYNLEEFPDSAAFSRSSTAIINPNDAHVTFKTGADGKYVLKENSDDEYDFDNNTSYEENAINALYGVYTAFIQESWSALNDKLNNKYNISTDFQFKSDDLSEGVSESAKKAKIRNLTNRYTLIMVDSVDGKVYLSSYLQFYLEDADEINLIDTTSVIKKAREKLVNLEDKYGEEIYVTDDDIREAVESAAKTVRARRSADIVPSYKVFYNDDGYSKLNTVYLMTKPLSKQFKYDGIAVYFTDSVKDLNLYNEQNRLEIYVAPQMGLVNEVLSDKDKGIYRYIEDKDKNLYIEPVITGTYEPVISDNLQSKIQKVLTALPTKEIYVHYADGWFNTSEGTDNGYIFLKGYKSVDNKLVKSTSADMIYDLKVTVYESSSGKWKNKLTELNTSTQQ